MSNLVCVGKTYELRGDSIPVPVIGEMPKVPQKVRLIKRVHMSIVSAIRTKHNGYKPGTLFDLCTDQCRFSLPSGLMCGLKVVGRTSWCASHDAVVHGRFLEAAE